MRSAASRAAENDIVTDSPITFSALTESDRARLGRQRALVEQYLGRDPDNLRRYESAAGKLGTIRAILDAGVFRADQTFELQCLGIVLGDALVQEFGMEWVMVEDEYGRDPATRVPGTSIVVYPLTMVSKRIERGEAVDVFVLFNAVAAQVNEMRATGW
jgi:hypothetical protein